ncbi:MAG: hypothetical protein GKR96_05455 [Gammaproteobacteria bacterium]|nr:hypothetical protein [Gammaproteobacteria bacterium]
MINTALNHDIHFWLAFEIERHLSIIQHHQLDIWAFFKLGNEKLFFFSDE